MQKLIEKAADRQYGGPLLLLLLRIRISPALGFGHASETHRTSSEFVNIVSPLRYMQKTDQSQSQRQAQDKQLVISHVDVSQFCF